jgi:hypothetical protein
MATLTWFVTSNLAGTAQQEMSVTDPGTEVSASPTYGWTVGTTASGNFSSADAQTQQAAGTFSSTAQPDGTIVTTANAGDCWRTTTTYAGIFASGNWVFHACIRATVAGGTSRARFRLFRGATGDGSSATEITSSAQVGSTVTPATGSTTDSTVTVNLGNVVVSNEYLFVQWAWETVTAGSMSTNDIVVRVGNASSNGSRVTTPDFAVVQDQDHSIRVLPPFV